MDTVTQKEIAEILKDYSAYILAAVSVISAIFIFLRNQFIKWKNSKVEIRLKPGGFASKDGLIASLIFNVEIVNNSSRIVHLKTYWIALPSAWVKIKSRENLLLMGVDFGYGEPITNRNYGLLSKQMDLENPYRNADLPFSLPVNGYQLYKFEIVKSNLANKLFQDNEEIRFCIVDQDDKIHYSNKLRVSTMPGLH